MQLVERRSILKGLVATALAAAIAPHVIPRVLEGIPVEAAPVVETFQRARAYIPISLELVEDFPNLEAEMRRLMVDAANDYEGRVLVGEIERMPQDKVDQFRWPNQALFFAPLSSPSR